MQETANILANKNSLKHLPAASLSSEFFCVLKFWIKDGLMGGKLHVEQTG